MVENSEGIVLWSDGAKGEVNYAALPNILKIGESGQSQDCSNNLMDVISKIESKCPP